jgi:hypothetical protein
MGVIREYPSESGIACIRRVNVPWSNETGIDARGNSYFDSKNAAELRRAIWGRGGAARPNPRAGMESGYVFQ